MNNTFLSRIITFLGVICVCLMATSVARAATYYVATNGNDLSPGTQAQPFRTLARGIFVAVNGDTVLVANGTYTGAGNRNLNFGGKNIMLKSLGGVQNCILDCQGTSANPARGIQFVSGETAQAILDGFTIRNGYITQSSGGGSGGAVVIDNNSSPTLRNCVFTGNTVLSEGNNVASGGAVLIRDSSPILLDCQFFDNIARSSGSESSGGALYSQDSQIVLSDCLFDSNTAVTEGAEDARGGAIRIGLGRATLTRCTLTRNRAECTHPTSGMFAIGGGMEVDSGAQVTLINCTLSSNTVATGFAADAGGFAALNSSATLTNCRISGNTAESNNDARGGGLTSFGSSVSLLNCLVVGNLVVGNGRLVGGGMESSADSNTTLTNTIFVQNTGDRALYVISGTAVVTNSIFYGHVGTGEIGANPNVNPTVTYSNILGGYTGAGNINSAPLFVRNPSAGSDGQWGTADDDNGDLHMQANSPCIDAGTASAPGLPPADFVGNIRNQGIAPDMGIYEVGTAPYIAANVYVDKASGSDTTGDGSPALPFQTVTRALSLSVPTGYTVIHIKAGNYGSDRPRVTGRVRFINWGNVGQASIGKP